MRRRASAALALVLAFAAVAQEPTPTPTPTPAPAESKRPGSDLRLPRGPIKITAERADLEQRETALYRGNVRLSSAELELTGDRLELRQPVRGEFQATLSGKPARLRHNAPAGAPPIAASAGQIVYDTRSGVVTMTGGAQLERGPDTVRSESIRYDLVARRISATGAAGEQVQIVIQPPERESQENKPAVPQNTAPPPGSASQP